MPLVAHVERYFHDGIDLDRVNNWIDMGCKIQVNRTSILGLQGKVVQKNALSLLENGMVHIVATDTHRTTGSRVSRLSDVSEFLEEQFGEDNARILTYENPLHIIEDEDLDDMIKVERKKHFVF